MNSIQVTYVSSTAAKTGLVRQGRITFMDYLKSVYHANSYAAWDRKDMRPFVHLAREFIVGAIFKR